MHNPVLLDYTGAPVFETKLTQPTFLKNPSVVCPISQPKFPLPSVGHYGQLITGDITSPQPLFLDASHLFVSTHPSPTMADFDHLKTQIQAYHDNVPSRNVIASDLPVSTGG